MDGSRGRCVDTFNFPIHYVTSYIGRYVDKRMLKTIVPISHNAALSRYKERIKVQFKTKSECKKTNAEIGRVNGLISGRSFSAPSIWCTVFPRSCSTRARTRSRESRHRDVSSSLSRSRTTHTSSCRRFRRPTKSEPKEIGNILFKYYFL
jgi:hypothetical protein